MWSDPLHNNSMVNRNFNVDKTPLIQTLTPWKRENSEYSFEHDTNKIMGYHGNGCIDRRATSKEWSAVVSLNAINNRSPSVSSTGYDTIFTTECMKSKDIVSKHVLYDRTEADSLCWVRGDNIQWEAVQRFACFNLQPDNYNCTVAFKGPHIVQSSVSLIFCSLVVSKKKDLLVSRKLIV